MSLFNSLVPKEFKPFLKHIGPSAFKVVDWKATLSDAASIASRLASSQPSKEVLRGVESHLPANVTLTSVSTGEVGTTSSEKPDGQLILQIYFSQLLSPSGLFIDLRARNFSQKGDSLIWSPSNLYHQWNDEFRLGLLAVYQGYYTEQESQITEGLKKMGLVRPDMSASQVKEIQGLLLDHVGSENPEQLEFKLEKFEASFENFFSVLKKQGLKLPPDFLFLGVYLVTLYSCLEELGGLFNVKKAAQNSLLND